MNTVNNEHFFGSKIVETMLEELIARHQSFQKLEKTRNIWAIIMIIFSVFMLFISNEILMIKSEPNQIFTQITNEPRFIFLLFLVMLLFSQFHFLTKKTLKAEKDFEELRIEIIERSNELWESDILWEKRHEVYTYMKKVHNINLYFC